MDDGRPGPAQLVLTATVARRYYLDNRTKVEIADELGLSRFKVARLLEQARESGMVRIEVGHPGVVDVELSGRLQERFGLRQCVVVDVPEEDESALRRQLGCAAAELLEELITPADVLGLTWSRSVTDVVAELRRLPPVPVVQLTGALTHSGVEENSVELVRRVAAVTKGPAHYFYSPMIVGDATTARALRRQPEVASCMSRFPSVTLAVVGIGAWTSGRSTIHDALSDAECAQLAAAGVCAEVAGIVLDEHGALVHSPLADRLVGVSGPRLQQVPLVVGVPYGRDKARAVRASVRSGIVDALVAHSSLARELIALGP